LVTPIVPDQKRVSERRSADLCGRAVLALDTRFDAGYAVERCRTLRVTTDAAQIRALSPRPLAARLDELVGSGVITRERADAYLVDQDAREAGGRWLSATPLYCVSGIKPRIES
jgi:hypothetical protein